MFCRDRRREEDRFDRRRRRDGEADDKDKDGKEESMEDFLAAKRAKPKDDTIMTRTGVYSVT